MGEGFKSSSIQNKTVSPDPWFSTLFGPCPTYSPVNTDAPRGDI